ncbi:hypothetical protein KIW84_040937 [Lathyrus oleraceus]|uniref:AAA+ ATPase domain-containing protein n=1 Tax=Pisum sativum TaxID=3888 RepID=A0A9D4X8F9_PEA|nr:hypothetical protein KIW84_040937 [Pisum sativum]
MEKNPSWGRLISHSSSEYPHIDFTEDNFKLDCCGILANFSPIEGGDLPYILMELIEGVVTVNNSDHERVNRKRMLVSDGDELKFQSAVYEALSKAIAKHFDARLLIVDLLSFSAETKAGSSNKRISKHKILLKEQLLKAGSRVSYENEFGVNFPGEPVNGSTGLILLYFEDNSRAKVGVRFDKPFKGGNDLGGICEVGYGYFCNARHLNLLETQNEGDDFNKKLVNRIFEFASNQGEKGSLVVLLQNLEKVVEGEWHVLKNVVENLPSNVVLIVSHTQGFEEKTQPNQKQGLSQFQLLEKRSRQIEGSNNPTDELMEQIGGLFPNKLTIHLPKDHTSLSRWKQQLEHHVKSINAQLNAVTIRSDVFIDGELEEKVMADVISPSDIGITFNDIGALENVKNTLRELIMLPLQRPELFSKGQLTKPCKGILLFGPPGTGKTMLAKAIATEAGANFINVSLSSIISKWSGESEKYIKALFSIAHKIAPTVIFIDEVDSLLGKRGGADSSYNDAHYNKIKTEFFVHWDGLRTNENNRVLVLTATNRPWDLDDAVIRRLPRRLLINLPDASNREKILKLILAADHLSMDVDLEELANKTSGYSGSDLKDLCVAAAYCPIRERLEIEKKEGSELYSSVDIRPLKMEDLLHALKEVRASFKLDSSIMDELRKWNEQFGGAADESKEERYMNYFI